MKIKIEREINAPEICPDEVAEELKQQLFEICEDWVTKGIEPTSLKIEGD